MRHTVRFTQPETFGSNAVTFTMDEPHPSPTVRPTVTVEGEGAIAEVFFTVDARDLIQFAKAVEASLDAAGHR